MVIQMAFYQLGFRHYRTVLVWVILSFAPSLFARGSGGGSIGLEGRIFRDDNDPLTRDYNISVKSRIENTWKFRRIRRTKFNLAVYGRIDETDPERNLVVIEELNAYYRKRRTRLYLGWHTLAWSNLDVFQQTDFINSRILDTDNVFAPEKVGEPMLMANFRLSRKISLEMIYLPTAIRSVVPSRWSRNSPLPNEFPRNTLQLRDDTGRQMRCDFLTQGGFRIVARLLNTDISFHAIYHIDRHFPVWKVDFKLPKEMDEINKKLQPSNDSNDATTTAATAGTPAAGNPAAGNPAAGNPAAGNPAAGAGGPTAGIPFAVLQMLAMRRPSLQGYFIPVFHLGGTIQSIIGQTLLRIEADSRRYYGSENKKYGRIEQTDHITLAAGIEYSYGHRKGAESNISVEYQRFADINKEKRTALSAFQNDISLTYRLMLNDVRDNSFGLTAIVDLERDKEYFGRASYRTRLSDRWSLNVILRVIYAPKKEKNAAGLEVLDGSNLVFSSIVRYF